MPIHDDERRTQLSPRCRALVSMANSEEGVRSDEQTAKLLLGSRCVVTARFEIRSSFAGACQQDEPTNRSCTAMMCEE